jgi:tRNA-modifying protein YgfZ
MNEQHLKNKNLDHFIAENLKKITKISCKIKRQSYSIVKVSGTDATLFLQGQLTGDCNLLASGSSLLMGWCRPNGRVQNLVHIIRSENDFFLLIRKEQTSKMLSRLKIFILRSNVTIVDISEESALFTTFNTDDIAHAIATIGRQGSLCWWIVAQAKENELWKDISAHEIDETALELHAIINGIPCLVEELTDTFLPQEIGLEQLNGLSFNKGCYPGQEIIARVKYRGKVKRHLVKIEVFNAHQILPATRIFDDSNLPVGIVLRSVATSKDAHLLLAVLNLGVTHALLTNEPKAVLEITPLND